MNAAEKKHLDDTLEKAIAVCCDHFDSVQIIATKQIDGYTHCTRKGIGNWYARVQSAREFVEMDQAMTHFQEAPKPPPEDGEDWKAEK